MILDTPVRSLRVVLGEAHATTACDIVACYGQQGPTGTFVTILNQAASTGTTPVTMVAAPPLSSQNLIQEVRLHNSDTVTHTVVLQLLDDATIRTVYSGTVAAGADWVYTPGAGTVVAGVVSFNTRAGVVTLTGGDVTTALTYTPYNATNPSGYQTAANVTATLASPPAIGGTTPAAGSFTGMNTGPLAGLRNFVINGTMNTWQRGTSFATPASGSYTADRWLTVYDGAGSTFTVARTLTSIPQTLYDAGFDAYLQYQVTVAGSGGATRVLTQRIEKVRAFSNRTVTVSAYLWADTSRTVSISLGQFFGTGGSPSAQVNTSATNWSVTTTPTWFSATFSLATVFGKTFGSNGDDYLALVLSLPLNTTMTINMAGVQLEYGSVATPFEFRPLQIETALCQRYYYTGYLGWVGYTPSIGGFVGGLVPLMETMRAAPTVTVGSAVTATNISAANVDEVTTDNFRSSFTSTAAGAVIGTYAYTAAAEL